MTIAHAVEITLIILPTVIFVILLCVYASRKGQLPAQEVGGILYASQIRNRFPNWLAIKMGSARDPIFVEPSAWQAERSED